ncbi:hypothetical protein [Methanobrevibacter sp. UBA313]|uniref:hypothetical protein n=1 Tax=Methanobrevibacter sp. UBA313 TaxID=1915477 RepID=UPI0039B90CD5
MLNIFNEKLKFKDKEISKTILGTATFTGETYFGHRSRLYELDLETQPENIAKIIQKAYDLGVRSINLVNHENLLKAYDMACENGVEMEVIATIGKSNVNYLMPDYEKAKEVDWLSDIHKLSKYNPSLMLIDEFLVNSYDWKYLENMLNQINKLNIFSGLITFSPFETTKKLLDSPIRNDFDFYMIPVNKYGYTMDSESFLKDDQIKLTKLLKELDKKIIIQKALAVGILQPKEAFEFIKKLEFADMITVGIASIKEAESTFNTLNNL